MSIENHDYKKTRPHYYFEIEKKNFVVKIANTFAEILQAQQLRFKVFSQVSKGFSGIVDIDQYDHNADHLIVVDRTTKAVVGTYRFLLSDKVSKHYSEREFDLSEFLRLPGRKMELGRASVDPDARAGVIITLLWRGIAEYLKLTNSDYLFGCSSMWDVCDDEILKLCDVFKTKSLVSDIKILPLKTHWPIGVAKDASEFSLKLDSLKKPINELKMNILYDQCVPTLVKTYIHVGAKFSVPPAYDPALKTFEFFGFVKTQNINSSFKKKYLEGT